MDQNKMSVPFSAGRTASADLRKQLCAKIENFLPTCWLKCNCNFDANHFKSNNYPGSLFRLTCYNVPLKERRQNPPLNIVIYNIDCGEINYSCLRGRGTPWALWLQRFFCITSLASFRRPHLRPEVILNCFSAFL